MNLTCPKTLEAESNPPAWNDAAPIETEVVPDRAPVAFAIVFLGTGALFVGGILELIF